MMRQILSFVAAAMYLYFAPHASATTIVDTTNGDTCCSSGVFYEISPSRGDARAFAFSHASAATITDITAFIIGSGSINLGIASDSSGQPGAFLFHESVTLGNTPIPISLTSLNWSIAAGTPYWLLASAVDANTFGNWKEGSSNNNTKWFNGSIWQTLPNAPEAIITATETTPLPAALPLFVSGLGGLGLFGWLRRRKSVALTA